MRRNRPRPPFRRRRPFPFGPRITRRLRPAARRALRQLQRAHQLMDQGQPAKAASIFDTLAAAAYQRNIPRASQLTLQSGKAWIEAGETERGIDRIREGLKQMVNFQQFQRMPAIGQRIVEGLRERGLEDQAARLEVEINALLSAEGLSLATQSETSARPKPPVKCPSCGGSVHPAEIEWVAADRAVCAYCGSILEAET